MEDLAFWSLNLPDTYIASFILYFSDVYSTDFPACSNHGGISLLVLLWRRLDKWV